MPPRRAAAAACIAKRKAFKRPSQAQMNRLWADLRSKDPWEVITTSPANNNLSPNDQTLFRYQFIDIYGAQGWKGIDRTVTEVYIQFVCEFVNRANNRNSPRQIPVCAVKAGAFFKNFYDAYGKGEDTSAASAQLVQDGLGPASFMQLRHLFLLDRTFKGHISLIVISPKARTVDYLDCDMPRFDDKMGVVFRLLSDHLGDLFLSHEWKIRQGHCPQQHGQRDCAIYTATNAMMIAFGYPIKYPEGDLTNRRYRMAADLLNGGNGMFYTPVPGVAVPEDQEQFHYHLADYWTGPKAGDRSRGFESLNMTMLGYLPKEIKAR